MIDWREMRFFLAYIIGLLGALYGALWVSERRAREGASSRGECYETGTEAHGMEIEHVVASGEDVLACGYVPVIRARREVYVLRCYRMEPRCANQL